MKQGQLELKTKMTSKTEEIIELKQRVKNGANLFYWIALLSWINIFGQIAKEDFYFLAGLGITQILTGFDINIAILGNFTLLIIFFLISHFARRGKRAAFIIGISLYAVDGLLFLLVKDWLSFALHGYILWQIIKGYKALEKLKTKYKITDSESFYKPRPVWQKNFKKKWLSVFLIEAVFLVLITLIVLGFRTLSNVGNIANSDWYMTIEVMSFLIIPFLILVSLLLSIYFGTVIAEKENHKQE